MGTIERIDASVVCIDDVVPFSEIAEDGFEVAFEEVRCSVSVVEICDALVDSVVDELGFSVVVVDTFDDLVGSIIETIWLKDEPFSDEGFWNVKKDAKGGDVGGFPSISG